MFDLIINIIRVIAPGVKLFSRGAGSNLIIIRRYKRYDGSSVKTRLAEQKKVFLWNGCYKIGLIFHIFFRATLTRVPRSTPPVSGWAATLTDSDCHPASPGRNGSVYRILYDLGPFLTDLDRELFCWAQV